MDSKAVGTCWGLCMCVCGGGGGKIVYAFYKLPKLFKICHCCIVKQYNFLYQYISCCTLILCFPLNFCLTIAPWPRFLRPWIRRDNGITKHFYGRREAYADVRCPYLIFVCIHQLLNVLVYCYIQLWLPLISLVVQTRIVLADDEI